MRKEDVMPLVDTLCRNFESITLRIRESSRQNMALENTLEEIESREIEDRKQHDKIMEELNSILRDNELQIQADIDQEVEEQKIHQNERDMMDEIERLRKTVKQLEEDGAKKQSMMTQKRQKYNEEKMSYEALLASRDNLLTDIDKLTQEIADLENEVQTSSGKIHNQFFKNTKESINLKDGKSELRKRHEEAVDIEKKVKKAEETLIKDAKRLEGRRSRLNTLRHVNKALQKRVSDKIELEARYVELTEQSMNLQYLISEAMRDMAHQYKIRESEVKGSNPFELFNGPDEVLARQMQYINELNGYIRQKTIEVNKKRFGRHIG